MTFSLFLLLGGTGEKNEPIIYQEELWKNQYVHSFCNLNVPGSMGIWRQKCRQMDYSCGENPLGQHAFDLPLN